MRIAGGLLSLGLLGHAAAGAETAREHADRARELIGRGQLETARAELRKALQLSPATSEYWALLGVVLGMQQKLPESDSCFEKALRFDPADTATRRNLAWNQFDLGRLKEARANLERVLQDRPTDPAAVLLLGMIAEEQRDDARAIRLFRSVPEQVTQRPESIAALARAYYRTGEMEQARTTLAQLKTHPAGPTAVFLGGQVAAEMHDYPTAEALFQSIARSYPDRAKITYHLALSEYRNRRFADAAATLRGELEAGRVSNEGYNLLAWCLYQQDDFKGAAAALDQAIALDPGDESNYEDGAMMLLDHHMNGAALDAAQKAIQVAPDSYRAHRLLALVELKSGRVEDSESQYRRALELNPADGHAIAELATAQLDKGNAREAEETLKKAIQRFPREAILYQAYGSMLLWGNDPNTTEQDQRATELLEKAIALDPSLAEAYYQLGKLALRNDRPRNALPNLETAARLDPLSSKNHYALAQAYRKLGRASDAAREVKTFQALKRGEDRKFTDMTGAPSRGETTEPGTARR